MIHLKKIKIIETSEGYGEEVLRKGFEFECGHVNLIVGDQGCGKSTLLRMISNNSKHLEITLADHVISNGITSYYFDTEKDNPRVKDPQMYTSLSGKDEGIGYVGALTSRFRSHGEIMENMILDPLKDAKDCVVILDEPESGLSIKNQFRFIAAVKAAVERGCQFFIATHCYPVIQDHDVVSLEHWAKMPGQRFIDMARGAVIVKEKKNWSRYLSRAEKQYKASEDSKVGSIITCPACGKAITKRTYQHKFCCTKCKERYWNNI